MQLLNNKKGIISSSDIIQHILKIAEYVSYVIAVVFILSLIYEYGFRITADTVKRLEILHRVIWAVFLVIYTMNIVLGASNVIKEKKAAWWLVVSMLYMGLLPFVFFKPEQGFAEGVWLFFNSSLYLKLMLLFTSVMQLSAAITNHLGKRTNPSVILAVSFFVIIIVGAGLLMLPNSTTSGITFIDALFTSTSAVCVTGLTTIDPSVTFTPMGFAIIALLIQIGGLGIMTITSFFTMFFMGNTSFYNQMIVKDVISSSSINSLLSTLLHILAFTAMIEAAGMSLIFVSIHGTLDMTLKEELAFSAFHAISAFCNAGFSTLPGNLGNEALMAGHQLTYITVSFLIIFGGLGFPILANIKDSIKYYLKKDRNNYKLHMSHLYNINTKIVVSVTLFLLLSSTLLFAIFEWNNTLAGMSFGDKIVHSFFNAASPRTAGFNSVDINAFHRHTIIVIMALMWIGGGSQSTAGGIKINTLTVAVLNIWTVLRNSSRVEIFKRTISHDSIRRSNATIVISITTLATAFFVLTLLEPDKPMTALAFECISALGTVGLTLNTTPLLCTGSKLIIMLLMFIGRVGMLTLLLGIIKPKKIQKYKYPSDEIIIN